MLRGDPYRLGGAEPTFVRSGFTVNLAVAARWPAVLRRNVIADRRSSTIAPSPISVSTAYAFLALIDPTDAFNLHGRSYVSPSLLLQFIACTTPDFTTASG